MGRLSAHYSELRPTPPGRQPHPRVWHGKDALPASCSAQCTPTHVGTPPPCPPPPAARRPPATSRLPRSTPTVCCPSPLQQGTARAALLLGRHPDACADADRTGMRVFQGGKGAATTWWRWPARAGPQQCRTAPLSMTRLPTLQIIRKNAAERLQLVALLLRIVCHSWSRNKVTCNRSAMHAPQFEPKSTLYCPLACSTQPCLVLAFFRTFPAFQNRI